MSFLLKTAILEMRQFLKGGDVSRSIMEVEVLSFAPKIWENVLDSVREIKTLSIFKHKIKGWTSGKCSCWLCKNYIGQVKFIWSCSNYFYWVKLSFSVLGHEKFIKVICVVCFFHFASSEITYCISKFDKKIFFS